MLRILGDTCVWLDLAKDYRQKPFLITLEHLIKADEVSIIPPRIQLRLPGRDAQPLTGKPAKGEKTSHRPSLL